MTVSEVLRAATERLAQSGMIESRREAVSLLAFVLGRDRTYLFAHPEYTLNADELRSYEDVVNRRSSHEPFQYIVGKQEFYGFDFKVNGDVLIPRPETEILVETAIERLSDREKPRLLEIGIGSGCISISLLKTQPAATAVGVDISKSALQVARENAAAHGVEDRIELVSSDVYLSLGPERFDAILANPPYVPSNDIEGLQPEVRLFEPHVALTDGRDGLTIIRQIIEGAPQHLVHDGFLLIEFGFGQSESVKSMYDVGEWQDVKFVDDHQGIPRIAFAERKRP